MKKLWSSLAVTLVLSSPFAVTAHAADAKQELPHVKIETNVGQIVLELNPKQAPKSVANFLKYVDDGFYNNTIFHRVIPGFMVQGGGFTTGYSQKETRAPIENEADNGLKNDRGTIAMARTGDPHSASAQFFINVANNKPLNFSSKTPAGWGYAVFGHVVSGMDVVDKIEHTPTGSGGPFPTDVPATQIVIKKVTRF